MQVNTDFVDAPSEAGIGSTPDDWRYFRAVGVGTGSLGWLPATTDLVRIAAQALRPVAGWSTSSDLEGLIPAAAKRYGNLLQGMRVSLGEHHPIGQRDCGSVFSRLRTCPPFGGLFCTRYPNRETGKSWRVMEHKCMSTRKCPWCYARAIRQVLESIMAYPGTWTSYYATYPVQGESCITEARLQEIAAEVQKTQLAVRRFVGNRNDRTGFLLCDDRLHENNHRIRVALVVHGPAFAKSPSPKKVRWVVREHDDPLDVCFRAARMWGFPVERLQYQDGSHLVLGFRSGCALINPIKV